MAKYILDKTWSGKVGFKALINNFPDNSKFFFGKCKFAVIYHMQARSF